MQVRFVLQRRLRLLLHMQVLLLVTAGMPQFHWLLEVVMGWLLRLAVGVL